MCWPVLLQLPKNLSSPMIRRVQQWMRACQMYQSMQSHLIHEGTIGPAMQHHETLQRSRPPWLEEQGAPLVAVALAHELSPTANLFLKRKQASRHVMKKGTFATRTRPDIRCLSEIINPCQASQIWASVDSLQGTC